MGLDITVGFDNAEDFLFDHEESDDDNWRNQHELSRTFCNFMCRGGVVEGEPELDQIAVKAGLDVTPMYSMMNYLTEDNIEEALEFEEQDEQEFREECKQENAKVEGNLDQIIQLSEQLIDYLQQHPTIYSELNDRGFDTLGSDYFKDLTAIKIADYSDNNITQDLKNLQRIAQFGKLNGAKTIFFVFG